jgi:hypothetical protein
MTPTELLVAALSSCVAFYVGRYLALHRLNRDGLQVTAEFAQAADGPARIGGIRLKLRVPGGIPPRREPALLGWGCRRGWGGRRGRGVSARLGGRRRLGAGSGRAGPGLTAG